MPEIIADNISVINSDELEGTTRLDAEYYQPKYLKVKETLNQFRSLSIYTENIIHPHEIKRIYSNNGETFLLTQNVRPLRLDFSTEVFIGKQDVQKLSRNVLKVGDVLLTRTGANFGDTAFYYHQRERIFASSHVLIIRPNVLIDGLYLAVFLNTKFGRKILDRGMYGGLQPEIAPSYLRTIPIPRFVSTFERDISQKVIKSLKYENHASSLYSQAEALLLEELGIKNIDRSHEPCYEVSSADTIVANRIDAEYYQPKYEKIVNTIKNYFGGFSFVKNEFVQVKDSFLKDNSKFYRYVEIGGIDISYGNIECLNLKGDKLPANAKIVTHGGELIISKVRPTRGAVTIIPEDWKEVVCSGAFVVLNENGTIRKEVLNVFLKSIIGKELLGRPVTGTSYPTVDDKDVLELPIPLIKQEIQNQIAELLNESYSTYRRAQILLEEAKKKVEEMIEKGKED